MRKIKSLYDKGQFEILLLQETRSDGSEEELKKWGKIFPHSQIYLTAYGTNAVGVGIIIKDSNCFRVDHILKDPLGRYIAVIGDHDDGRFLIGSFYCPSNDQDIRNFVNNDLYKMMQALENQNQLPEFIILAGDTNTTFSQLDKEGGSKKQKQGAINAFLGFEERFNLQDIFRIKNPNSKKYTWCVTNPLIIKERIDVIFTSQNLHDFIVSTDITPPYKTCSDHGIPYVNIKDFGIPTRGPGVWKFNNALLLEEDFVYEMRQHLPAWINEAKASIKTKGDQWGFIKHKIGEFS